MDLADRRNASEEARCRGGQDMHDGEHTVKELPCSCRGGSCFRSIRNGRPRNHHQGDPGGLC